MYNLVGICSVIPIPTPKVNALYEKNILLEFHPAHWKKNSAFNSPLSLLKIKGKIEMIKLMVRGAVMSRGSFSSKNFSFSD